MGVGARRQEGDVGSEAGVRSARLGIGAAVAVAGVAFLAAYVLFVWRTAAPSVVHAAAEKPVAASRGDGPSALSAPAVGPISRAALVRALVDETGSAQATEEAQERELGAEDYERAVQAQRRDERWAGPTTRKLEEDLRDKGARLGFRVRTIDCRQDSCFAELDFASLRAAREGFKAALGPPNQPDCPLRLLFPTDGSEDASVMGVMIVDCHDRRGRD